METATKPNFVFNAKKHVYTLDDKPLTGVTTILGVIAKPSLIQWAADMAVDYVVANSRVMDFSELGADEEQNLPHFDVDSKILKEARLAHRKKKEKAGDWGTEVHAEVEKYINLIIQNANGKACPEPEMDERIQQLITWAIENKVKFLASEKRLYSTDYWYAGTADIVCEIDGKRYIGDVKTSSGIYPEAFIQASAYAAALVEQGEYDHFDGVVIINLRKDGGFEYRYNYDLGGNFNCFRAALTIYRQLNAIK